MKSKVFAGLSVIALAAAFAVGGVHLIDSWHVVAGLSVECVALAMLVAGAVIGLQGE